MKKFFKGIKSVLRTAKYITKLLSSVSKTYIPLLFTEAIFRAAVPFINIIMPKFIIDELMGDKNIQTLIVLVSITIGANFVLNFAARLLGNLVEVKNSEMALIFDKVAGAKIMDMDFENTENPQVLDLKEKALYTINTFGALGSFVRQMVNIFAHTISIIGLVAIISTLHFLIVVALVAIVCVYAMLTKKSIQAQNKYVNNLAPVNRRLQYFAFMTSDFTYGKDIRMYNASPLIMNRIEKGIEDTVRENRTMSKIFARSGGLGEVGTQLQMLIVYAYICYKVIIKAIGIGSFTMYISSAISFGLTLTNLVSAMLETKRCSDWLNDFITFSDIKSKVENGTKAVDMAAQNTIEFRNVSFKYPRSEKYVLKNINITVHCGEKLSVVGQNGAGKTTFIKLLMRLYLPTEGEIYLNGVNINEFDFNEYMKLLSVVFQDYKLFAFSLKDNIIGTQPFDKEKVMQAIDKAGLSEDIEKLPYGIETPLFKSYNQKGTELSGGQSQKLALARALYKDASIIVLDEPTAALDPVSEYEIYKRFNAMSQDKTVVYISHRLSSCKFCDKIAVFHEGEIVQYGTHNQLVKEKGSKYEELYSAQAQYYT